MTPGSGYDDEWFKYTSQSHSKANESADSLRRFDNSLFTHIHDLLWMSLWERWYQAQRKELPHYWDQLYDLLRQVDAGTVCCGMQVSRYAVVQFWFDIWKVSS